MKTEHLAPRAALGPSTHLVRHVYAAGDGLYLLVGTHLGPNEPVYAVCWAASDYWAVHIWGPLAQTLNEHSTTEGAAVPSLKTMGLPDPLFYAELMATTKAQPGGSAPVQISASYRVAGDGSLITHKVKLGPLAVHYEAANPKPADLPIGIEYRLKTTN